MAIRHEQVTVTVSGTTGSGTTGFIQGRILSMHLDFATGTAATTDTTIATSATGGMPAITILTITDSATDAWYYPRHQVHSEAGAGLTYDGTRTVNQPVAIADTITVSLAQSTDTKTCIVTILYEDNR